MSDLSLVILAAGVGSRYGGLKQLDKVGPAGETLMEYSIHDALQAGFRRLVLVVRPETEDEFRDGIGRRIEGRLKLAFVHQSLDDLPGGWKPPERRTKPWGTGQAVLAAAPAVPGPFAVINADDWYGPRSYRSLVAFLNAVDPSTPQFALQGFEIGPTLTPAGAVSRGLCRVDSAGRLRAIEEVLEVVKDGDGGRYVDGTGRERRLRGDEPVSMNMWGFTPAVFGLLRQEFSRFLQVSGSDRAAEFMLPAAIQELISAGTATVSVLTGSGPWCGITYRDDRPRAVSFIADRVEQGVYPHSLWGPEPR
jgi:dTDP-glucose pyrophosphorylase